MQKKTIEILPKVIIRHNKFNKQWTQNFSLIFLLVFGEENVQKMYKSMQINANRCKSMQIDANHSKLMQIDANRCKSMQINAN